MLKSNWLLLTLSALAICEPTSAGEPSCVTQLLQTASWTYAGQEPAMDFAHDLDSVASSATGLQVRDEQFARQCDTTLALARRWSFASAADSCALASVATTLERVVPSKSAARASRRSARGGVRRASTFSRVV